ncbi:MAG: site-specific DNA-methyltransferase [Candidatus Scalindua sp.]|nr:site-specific DNA-methyltransferase [Candidatus Scalindua sp.]MCR4344789.1 site-specific DNA-methyltransferase [Candidatus Scalindua sp.]
MSNKQKLELTWIGKGNQPKLEPRILIEDPVKSYGYKNSENMLIYGDNLLALKALEQDFAGQIKCICIDPPYNTGSAFEYYDDGLEHSIWLSLMRDRLIILKTLLSDMGSIWITIDDNECHYLKVLMDEIFGRKNFVANVVWQKRTSPDMRATIGAGHDHILVFAKDIDKFKEKVKPLPKTDEQKRSYKNPDKDPRGPWVSSDFTAQGYRPNQMYKIKTPGGKEYYPPDGRCWKNIESVYLKLLKDGRMWFGKGGNGVPRRKTYLEESLGQTAWTWWTNSEVGHNQEAKKEIIALFGSGDAFITPKPERLIKRIFDLTTDEGDYILDSFGGSGTTGAVAHKMGRKWIMLELGEHCHTHCLPRLKKVMDGTDQGGISKSVDWKGGGGFKYYYLAPSLLKEDKYGNWVIDERYNADMLAAAMAKHEGFKYNPDEQIYWKQGRSTEKDFIFTTTKFVTLEYIDKIHEQMSEGSASGGKPGESLLLCCKSFSKACENRYTNITIKKIPKMLLGSCEFGKDDYSLNIINMPACQETQFGRVEDDNSGDSNEESPNSDVISSVSKKPSKKNIQLDLFK